LKQKRLDLNLTQKQVSKLLGCSLQSINQLENNKHDVQLSLRPRVIKFIGFAPYNPCTSIVERLKQIRENLGLSHIALSKRMGIDPATISSWERGEHQPTPPYIYLIMKFLRFGFANDFSQWHQKNSIVSESELILCSIKVPCYVEYEPTWDLSKKFVAWRYSLGLSIKKMARLVGVNPKTWARWEKGEHPSIPDREKQVRYVLTSLESSTLHSYYHFLI